MKLLRKADNLAEAYALQGRPHRAETLTDAYNNLDPNTPLPGKDHPFYVQRPEPFGIELLLDALRATRSRSEKMLFSGHRGSGKSTELARLAQKLADRYLVTHFSVENLLDLGDLDYQDILVTMGGQVYETARRTGLRLDADLLHNLVLWYKTTFFEQDEIRQVKGEIEAEVQAFVVKLGTKIGTESPKRQYVRAQAEKHLSDLLTQLDALVDDVCRKSGRRVLVLVDGLDKIYNTDLALKMFLSSAGALTAPRCLIVYTVPIILFYASELGQVRMGFRGQFQLPNVSPFNPDGSRRDEGWHMLDAILQARVADRLLPRPARETLIEVSGGVLKHFISLAGDAALLARRRPGGEQETVTPEDVARVAVRMRTAARPTFTAAQRAELRLVASGHTFTNSPEARDLAMNLHILQYLNLNGEEWWDVHPVLRPLLEEPDG